MRIKFPGCVSICSQTGELILECPEKLVVTIMDRGIPGVIGPEFELDIGEIVTATVKSQLNAARAGNWGRDNFNPDEWKYEVSSGYNGYRSQVTGEWIYESEYKSRCEHLQRINDDSFVWNN